MSVHYTKDFIPAPSQKPRMKANPSPPLLPESFGRSQNIDMQTALHQDGLKGLVLTPPAHTQRHKQAN